MLTSQDLSALYKAQNDQWDDCLRDASDIYLDRLRAELSPSESVSAVLAFESEYRDLRGHTQALPALLAVTSLRVLHILAPKRILGRYRSVRSQAGSSSELEVRVIPYSAMRGVDGRRSILSLGLERELYLDLKDGTFVKIRGLPTERSKLAEEYIREALVSS